VRVKDSIGSLASDVVDDLKIVSLFSLKHTDEKGSTYVNKPRSIGIVDGTCRPIGDQTLPEVPLEHSLPEP